MKRLKTAKILMMGSILLLITGAGCSPTAKKGNERVHINELECREFLQSVAPGDQLYFSGQSKFLRDVNKAKLQAFNNAQAAMARAVKSSVSSACQENTSYESNDERTRKSVKQKCKTDIKSENVDVSDLSQNRSYCLETKKFTTGGVRKEIFRQTVRIQVSEDRFTAFIKQQSP
jgi:hypothetical protein